MGIPRINSERVTTPRRVLANPAAKLLLVGGAVISGTYSRDPGNTGYVDVLRAGLILGKRTADSKYAPSILGVLAEAYAQGGTEMTVSAAVATELVRRIGASGTFKVTGPAVSGGTVRTLTVTYSAVDTATGVITLTALGSAADDEALKVVETTAGVAAVSGVDDVQTFTLATDTDGGTFRFGYRGKVTAELAWNVSTADAQTALRALHADLAACVVSGTAGVEYVVTTAAKTVADLTIVNDVTSDGGVDEGGIVAVHTTQGVTAVVAAAEVQTITLAGSPTGGTWRVGYNGEWTPELAWNISTAALQTALRALTGLSAVTVAGTAGSSYVVTFASGTAYPLLDLDATFSGTPGALIAGSLVQPTDGSETPLVVISDGSGIKVTDADGVSQDQALTGDALIGGELLTANLLNYPSDASLKAWLRTQLRAAGQQFLFDDQF